MRRLVSCLGLLLAGCATVHRDPLPAPLQPFAEASRFVPEGMVSFAFLGRTGGAAFEGSQREVWAGRDFEWPDSVGFGLSRSVYIGDFGENGVDAESLGIEADAESVEIEGHACWHAIPGARSARIQHEEWRTVVDGRFALLAHHRDVLAAALRRRGGLPAVLAPFGDLSFVPADAAELVFGLPRPGEPLGWFKPVPIEPMVFVFSAAPARFEMFSRTTPPPDYHVLLEQLCVSPDPPVRQIGSWRCQGDALRTDEEVTDFLRGFYFYMLFGHSIFI